MNSLRRQYETAWKLASYHLEGLTTDDCLWRPAQVGPHVRQEADGLWRADWPTHEGYDLGAPSIAWITWHMLFWWSMALDHSFGEGTLVREQVTWPGSAEGVRHALGELDARWREMTDGLTDAELAGKKRVKWPFKDRPFSDLMAWLNLELAKNAAELGYVRFLRAVAR